MSIRIPVDAFAPNRTQRKTLKRNADLVRRRRDAWATERQFELFRRYLDSRHADGGMADMDAFDYASMVDETPVNTAVIEYSLPREDADGDGEPLMGACLSDILCDGLSMVYSFFEPSERARGLGAFMILDHVRLAAEMGLDFVYLGYWVDGSPKMSYKTAYRPFELCDGATWRRFADEEAYRAWRKGRIARNTELPA